MFSKLRFTGTWQSASLQSANTLLQKRDSLLHCSQPDSSFEGVRNAVYKYKFTLFCLKYKFGCVADWNNAHPEANYFSNSTNVVQGALPPLPRVSVVGGCTSASQLLLAMFHKCSFLCRVFTLPRRGEDYMVLTLSFEWYCVGLMIHGLFCLNDCRLKSMHVFLSPLSMIKCSILFLSERSV